MTVLLAYLHTFVTSNVGHGIISGFVAGAVVDLHAVTQFKNWSQLAAYDWNTASMRWFTGALSGGLAALGLGVIS